MMMMNWFEGERLEASRFYPLKTNYCIVMIVSLLRHPMITPVPLTLRGILAEITVKRTSAKEHLERELGSIS